MSQYYPLGTVVKLDIGSDRLFMVAGYFSQREKGKVYDYFAVPFPLGLTDASQYICFNHSMVEEVVHQGYCNESCQKLLDGFDGMTAQLKQLVEEKKKEPSAEDTIKE